MEIYVYGGARRNNFKTGRPTENLEIKAKA